MVLRRRVLALVCRILEDPIVWLQLGALVDLVHTGVAKSSAIVGVEVAADPTYPLIAIGTLQESCVPADVAKEARNVGSLWCVACALLGRLHGDVVTIIAARAVAAAMAAHEVSNSPVRGDASKHPVPAADRHPASDASVQGNLVTGVAEQTTDVCVHRCRGADGNVQLRAGSTRALHITWPLLRAFQAESFVVWRSGSIVMWYAVDATGVPATFVALHERILWAVVTEQLADISI